MRRIHGVSIHGALCLVLALMIAPLAAQSPVAPVDPHTAARENFDRGELQRAAEVLEQLRDQLARAGGLPLDVNQCHELLAVVYQASGRHQDALTVAADLYARLNRAGQLPGTAADRQDAAVLAARACDSLAQPAEALRWYRQALAIAAGHAADDPTWAAVVELEMAAVASEVDDRAGAEKARRRAAAALAPVVASTPQSELEIAHARAARRLLARAQSELGQLDAALTTLAGLNEPPLLASPRRRAGNLAAMAELCHDVEQFAHERDLLVEALAAYQAPTEPELDPARWHHRLATAYWALHQWHEALAQWEAAALAYERFIQPRADGWLPATDDRLIALEGLTAARQQRGEIDQAHRAAAELVALVGDALDAEDPRRRRAVATHAALSGKLRRYDEAEQGLRTTLDYWRRRRPPQPGQLASVLNNLGVVARERGRYDEAAAYLQEALTLVEQHFADDDLRAAEVSINLATLLAAQGRYAEATRRYYQALEICRRREPALHHLAAEAKLNLAMLELSQERVVRAAQLAQEALAERQSLPNFAPADLVPHHITLAAIGLAGGQLNEAGQAIAQARSLAEAEGLFTGSLRAMCQYQQGMWHYRRGEIALAKAAWYEALAAQRQEHLPTLATRTLSYLGLLEYKAGQLEAARARLAEAVAEQASLRVAPKLHFATLFNYAQTLADLGARDEAIAALEEAVQVVELPRASVSGGQQQRARYFASFVPAYDLLVQLYVEAGRDREALLIADQARNRTFVDQLLATGADVRAALRGNSAGQGLLTQEQTLLEQHQDLQARLNAAAAGYAPDTASDELSAELARVRGAYLELLDRMHAASPFYGELLSRTAARVDASTALDRLVAGGDVLLAYHLGHRASYVFVARQGDGVAQVVAHPLAIDPASSAALNTGAGPLTRRGAARLVARYRAQLGGAAVPRDLGAATDAPVAVLAPAGPAQLAGVLLPAPVRNVLSAHAPNHILVVTDGALARLPLELLPLTDAEPPRYVDDELPPLVYLPSLSVAAALARRATTAVDAPVSLLTVGDPVLGGQSSDPTRQGAPALPELAAADEECRRVATAFAPYTPQVLVGGDATKSRVLAALAGQRFLHFATHGLIDVQNDNLFGALVLSAEEDAAARDDLLLHEIQALSLAGCELAVLSACNTSIGAERPFEAESTFARAFLAAGARRVVSSYWSVEDAATSELIGGFFEDVARELQAGRAPDYARLLQVARRRLREDARHPEWARPVIWAPFVLSGAPAE